MKNFFIEYLPAPCTNNGISPAISASSNSYPPTKGNPFLAVKIATSIVNIKSVADFLTKTPRIINSPPNVSSNVTTQAKNVGKGMDTLPKNSETPSIPILNLAIPCAKKMVPINNRIINCEVQTFLFIIFFIQKYYTPYLYSCIYFVLIFIYDKVSLWSRVRVVECTSLLKRQGVKALVGSNPTGSAKRIWCKFNYLENMNKFLGNDFNKETDDAIYFYTPVFYALDNFSAYVVDIWGNKFLTAEHAYQWKKFENSKPELANDILMAPSPSIAKKISDEHRTHVPIDFHNKKTQIMEEILKAKIRQHEKVRRVLRETGNKKIIENSPIDNFWGAGPDGNGENILGKIWMKIRDSEDLGGK